MSRQHRFLVANPSSKAWGFCSQLNAELRCDVVTHDQLLSLDSSKRGVVVWLVSPDELLDKDPARDGLTWVKDQVVVCMEGSFSDLKSLSGDQQQIFSGGAIDFKGMQDAWLSQLSSVFAMGAIQIALLASVFDRELMAETILHDINNHVQTLASASHLIQVALESNDHAQKNSEALKYIKELDGGIFRLGKFASHSLKRSHESIDESRQLTATSWELAVAFAIENLVFDGLQPRLNAHLPGEWLAVVGEQKYLNLIALNIIQNAMKYRRKDVTPVLSVKQSHTTVDGASHIRTIFMDNGIGIGSLASTAFMPKNSDGQGGLGLPLVAKAVGMMGGRVRAIDRGQAEKGTEIWVDLPSIG
jgi:signal transduction histidine kinase